MEDNRTLALRTLEEKARRYETLTAEIEDREKERKEIRKALADNSDGYKLKQYGARVVDWIMKRIKKTDWNKMLEDHPEIDISKYTTYSVTYAISVKKR